MKCVLVILGEFELFQNFSDGVNIQSGQIGNIEVPDFCVYFVESFG